MIRFALALAALLLWGMVSFPAAAQNVGIPSATPPPRLIELARKAETAGDYARALTLYGMVLDQAPTSRQARRAEKRRRYLQQRSEGDFEPLRKLAAIRRLPPQSKAELDAFAAQVPGFPDGINKREAWHVVGDGYLRQFGDAKAALAAYRAWLASADLPESERVLAVSGAALARAELEGAAPSLDDMNRQNLGHRAEAIALRAKVVARYGVPIAWTLLLGFAAAGLGLTCGKGFRPANLRRVFTWPRAGASLWLLGLPLLLIYRYDDQLGPQFAWLVGALAATLLLSAIVAAGRPSPPQRRALAGMATIAAVAAAFLAIEHSRMMLDVMMALEQKPS